jgi:hypothetical protein
VGTVTATTLLHSALPPKSAIILAFGVLRQINFRSSGATPHASTAHFFRFGCLPPRKTEIIAEPQEIAKRSPQYF